MARSSRNNVDYFPHPVKNGKKMSYMMNKYDHLGYSSWYQLLEQLGDANYHYLDLSEETELMLVSTELMTTEEKLKEIINDLVKLKVFNKELWERYNIVFCDKFIDDISDAYKRRNNKCITFNYLCIHLKIKSNFIENKTNINTQSKVKDNKQKDIKERKLEFSQLLLSELYINDYEQIDLKEFYEYWSEHGENDKKMRYEKQTSFDVNLRLKKWLNNKAKWNNGTNGTKQSRLAAFAGKG